MSKHQFVQNQTGKLTKVDQVLTHQNCFHPKSLRMAEVMENRNQGPRTTPWSPTWWCHWIFTILIRSNKSKVLWSSYSALRGTFSLQWRWNLYHSWFLFSGAEATWPKGPPIEERTCNIYRIELLGLRNDSRTVASNIVHDYLLKQQG